MRVPFKMLDEIERSVYDTVMSGVITEKIDCWNEDMPEDFTSEFERSVMNDYR